MPFRAIFLEKSAPAKLASLEPGQLPSEGDVLVDVEYSTINYKDGLAITGTSPVVRRWPMVAGIDGVGRVLESSHPKWRVGDRVLIDGYGIGEEHWGCLAERARLRGEWLLAVPSAFTPKQAMAVGTAGFTAMLCVLALERAGVAPGTGEVLVTGASGGVGTLAVCLLAKLGHRVVASTGKAAEHDLLRSLGAGEVVDRSLLSAPGKALQRERWAAVVDTVGSHTLANACAQTRYGGVVAACGNAQGMDFPGTVAPFILRGVSLLGINSVLTPMPVRERAWSRLAEDLDPRKLDSLTREIGLAEVFDVAKEIVQGKIRGRVVVDVRR
jgi:acrylyl-CoA reductase (NADPH)